MKNIYLIIVLGFISLMQYSCTTSRGYVKSADSFYRSVYGSKVYASGFGNPKLWKDVAGELIAIDSVNVFVLETSSKEVLTVPRDAFQKINIDIVKIKMQYTGAEDAMTMFNSLVWFTHGWFMIITLPVNLAVMSSAKYAHYSMQYPRNISLDDLSKFARFPQGIPPNIKLSQIK